MRVYLVALVIFILSSCNESPQPYDLILHNAKVYTVAAEEAKWAKIVGVKDGKIALVSDGKDFNLEDYTGAKKIDCDGKFLMPGFIEGHGHFSGMGQMLINLNLLRSSSWEQIVSQVEEKVKSSAPGEWIEGRGWHQEKWDSIDIRNIDGYPLHHELSKISPDNPVILYHASGHSLFANDKAMQDAGITKETEVPLGGAIIRDNNGEAIGVFEERAMGLINRAFSKYEAGLSPDAQEKKWYQGIEMAQEECLKKGITSFQDAGSHFDELEKYSQMAKEGKLDLRLWAMIRHHSKDLKNKVAQYREIGTGNNFFTCRAIKSELDGALGSFGAWLLEDYEDKPGFYGQNTTTIEELEEIAAIALENDMQLCIHAIGDKGNRESLNVIEKLQQEDKDYRWRIEHAQHLSIEDIHRFKRTGTIASMQGIHCTSDAPFVEKRLGTQRAKEGAYAWRSIIDAGAVVTNGTDAPVEDVDPIECFYATVTRKRVDSGFSFFPEQAMTRAEAIASYTRNNAFAAFEEDIKGSIEIGKVADLVLLSEDLINCSDDDILNTEVLMTMVNGIVKFKNDKF